MQTNRFPAGVIRWTALLALCTLTSGVIALVAMSDPPEVVPNEKDFDEDAVVDEVVADPSEDSTPGEVEIRSGVSSETVTRFEGRSNNDRFGESVAMIGDVSADDIDDILIGAPKDGDGQAYVFYGPFTEECPLVVQADDAQIVLSPLFVEDYEFGFAVAPLYDFNNDQIPDLRVAAKFLDAQGALNYRTYLFSGWTGEIMATATGPGLFAALEPIDGDSDYDADVDQDDMDRVMANLGRSGQLTRYDGDVNDDGVVDAQDVALVTARQGFRAYDTATSGSGCTLPNCVTISPEPPDEYCLCEMEPDDGVEGAVIGIEEGIAGGTPVIHPLPGPCGDQIAACLNDPRVIAAMQLIDARCYGEGGNAPGIIGKVYCKDCPPGSSPSGVTQISCGLFGRKVKVIICNNATDFCGTLAHELTHVAQACGNDLYNSCNDYKKWAKNQYHRLCAEIEAAQVAQQCNSPETCCAFACQAVKWKNCPMSCYDCCILSWGCCVNGRNTCEDAGNNPCTTP